MKFASLKSAGHNISDSLASGIGLMIGVYEINVFGEAAATRDKSLDVDFLRGTVTLGASRKLREAVRLYHKALPAFLIKHGVGLDEVAVLSARFAVAGALRRQHFIVTVENSAGKRAVDQYVGTPGRKLQRRKGERIADPEKEQ